MDIYLILWIVIQWYIIYFIAEIVPVLANGSFCLLVSMSLWHTSTILFFSVILKSVLLSLMNILSYTVLFLVGEGV